MRAADQPTLPPVDRVLKSEAFRPLIDHFGRTPVRETVRSLLDDVRKGRLPTGKDLALDDGWMEQHCRGRLETSERASLRPVFNMTGTVLHTNLGRALLPTEAQEALQRVASQASNLEYDLDAGSRGDRDQHVEDLMCGLTGAEAATVVNNNAAAVFLVLNSLALRKEVLVSRGELIEIGGSFRMPDIMARAGCKLREVGTTNRTHLVDFEAAISRRTALVLKVHTSNFAIQGFTASVDEQDLGRLSRARGIPFVIDLGSGTLVNLRNWGLPAEPTPRQAFANGAQLVTFSGDKLLGGPQAGIIVGTKQLINIVKKNPLKRALRMDKLRLAALESVLRLYRDPERLAQRLPTLRFLTRSVPEIESIAAQLKPTVEAALRSFGEVAIRLCKTQIGSGSLPVDLLPSICFAITPYGPRKGASLKKLCAAFRMLPIPVIGRVEHDALCLDLRCLEDAQTFAQQLDHLAVTTEPPASADDIAQSK